MPQLTRIACGREFAIRCVLQKPEYSVSEEGFGGVDVKVIADRPHQSLLKAASLVGLGRSNVMDLSTIQSGFLSGLEAELSRCAELGMGRIVSISFGEVNTVGDGPLFSINFYMIFSLGRIHLEPRCYPPNLR
jgi:hypothetical protein